VDLLPLEDQLGRDCLDGRHRSHFPAMSGEAQADLPPLAVTEKLDGNDRDNLD
jgi:hypothetical protein